MTKSGEVHTEPSPFFSFEIVLQAMCSLLYSGCMLCLAVILHECGTTALAEQHGYAPDAGKPDQSVNDS